jgi:hypothetical protein
MTIKMMSFDDDAVVCVFIMFLTWPSRRLFALWCFHVCMCVCVSGGARAGLL